MRIKKPKQFDPQKQYKPGERAIYRDMVIIAERWTKIKEDMAMQPGNIYPKYRCSRCVIDGKDCSKFCDQYGRSDKKRIYFKKLYGWKTLLYKKTNSDEKDNTIHSDNSA